MLESNKELLEKIAGALFEKEILVWEDICNLSQLKDA